MAIRIITGHPEALLEKFEQQLHHIDSRWGIDQQNGYFQRYSDSDQRYYFRYSLKEREIEILFIDVHNQYSTNYVNKYAGELIAAVLNIFTCDNLLDHLEVEPYNLPNS